MGAAAVSRFEFQVAHPTLISTTTNKKMTPMSFSYLRISLFDLKKLRKKAQLLESFYSVKYGLSIITSNVFQIISVMKTKTLVFPEK